MALDQIVLVTHVDAVEVVGHVKAERHRLIVTLERPYGSFSRSIVSFFVSAAPDLRSHVVLDEAEQLLRHGYFSARRRGTLPDQAAKEDSRRRWPDLDDPVTHEATFRRITSADSRHEISLHEGGASLIGLDSAIALIRARDRRIDLYWDFRVEMRGKKRVIFDVRHWRNFGSAAVPDGLPGDIFFKHLLTRADELHSGPFRQSTYRYWGNRVREAKACGMPISAIDLNSGEVCDAERFFDVSRDGAECSPGEERGTLSLVFGASL